jgi:hypothetical protein
VITRSTDVSPTRMARTTGVLYVLVVLCGIVGEIVVTNVIDAGDPGSTVDTIASHESVFGLGLVVLLTRLLLLTLLILSLYRLLGQVDGSVAAVMVAFGLTGVAVSAVALVLQFGGPLLLTGGDYSAQFSAERLQDQVQFFIDLSTLMDRAAQMFAVWVVLLGVLIHRSGYLPKLLGVLMMVAGVGYVVDFLLFALVPDLDWQIAGLAFLAEAVFPFWLLIRGVDLEGWQRCIAAGRGSDQPDVLKGHR